MAQGFGSAAPDRPAHLKSQTDDGDPRRLPRRIRVAAFDRSLSNDVLLDRTHKAKLKMSILADDLLIELAMSRATMKDALGV